MNFWGSSLVLRVQTNPNETHGRLVDTNTAENPLGDVTGVSIPHFGILADLGEFQHFMGMAVHKQYSLLDTIFT